MHTFNLHYRIALYAYMGAALFCIGNLHAADQSAASQAREIPFPQELRTYLTEGVRHDVRSCKLVEVNGTYFVCDATKKDVRESNNIARKNKAYRWYAGSFAAGKILTFLGVGTAFYYYYSRLVSRPSTTSLLMGLGSSLGACYLSYKASDFYAHYTKEDLWLRRREAHDEQEQKILKSAENIPDICGDVLPSTTDFAQRWHKRHLEDIDREKARREAEKKRELDRAAQVEKDREVERKLKRFNETTKLLEESNLRSAEFQRKAEGRRKLEEEQRKLREEQYAAMRLEWEAQRAAREREHQEIIRKDFVRKSDGRRCIPIEHVEGMLNEVGFFVNTSKHILEYLQNGYILALNERFPEGMRYIFAVRYSPDGTKIAVATNDASITILRADDLGVMCRFAMHIEEGRPDCLQWSPDSAQLIAAAPARGIRAWDLRANKMLYTKYGLVDYDIDPKSLTYHPSGKVFSCANFYGVVLYDARNGNELQRFKNASSLSFSPCGEKFALVDRESVIKIGMQKDMQDPDIVFRTLGTHEKLAGASSETRYVVLYSPQGNQLVSYDDHSRDNVLKIWNLCAKYDMANELFKVTTFPVALGNLIAEYAYETYEKYDNGGRIIYVTYAPDGKTILIAGYSSNKVIDSATLQELGKFRPRNLSSSVLNGDGAYASDSHETATYSDEDTILIGDGHGKIVQTIPGPFSEHPRMNISKLAYHPTRIGEFVSAERSGALNLYKRTGYIVDEGAAEQD